MVTKAPPVGASFNISRSEPGVTGRGVRGGVGGLVGFFVAKGACFGLDLGFFGKCFSETFEGKAGPP